MITYLFRIVLVAGVSGGWLIYNKYRQKSTTTTPLMSADEYGNAMRVFSNVKYHAARKMGSVIKQGKIRCQFWVNFYRVGAEIPAPGQL